MGEMEELHAADDQSHYEISLTAGQAFAAFVLLLLSLAAAFAFGLMIGKGQADERLVVQKETPVVTEASMRPKKSQGEIVELGVSSSDFEAEPAATPTTTTETTEAAAPSTDSVTPAAVVEEATPLPVAEPAAPATDDAARASARPVEPRPAEARPTPSVKVTTYAQLLSTSDQKTAERLAATLIDRGYTAAYVERGANDRGPIYRVRVKFDSDEGARAAEPKLREFSKEVWITTK
jgi:cell division septation protein DedD